jgi:hypothetical protein
MLVIYGVKSSGKSCNRITRTLKKRPIDLQEVNGDTGLWSGRRCRENPILNKEYCYRHATTGCHLHWFRICIMY